LKVVVLGYHDVGCACLQALIDLRQEVALVVTHEDDPGENTWFGSVRDLAAAHGLPVVTPGDVNAPEEVERIRALRPDALLSCYYRKILGPELLAIPPRGAFNMHGSLLPRFRGRAPVNWVLVKGETVTGVTLHCMTEKPDRGDIVGQKAVPITDEDTALTLHRRCAAAAGDLMREVWPLIESGKAPRVPQDPSKASYFGRRRPEDGRIDWSQPARACWNLVRAVTHPYPGAFTFAGGAKLFIWQASPVSGPSAGGAAPSAGQTVTSSVRVVSTGRGAAGERSAAVPPPGTVLSVVRGSGFTVATGEGVLLVRRAQLEGGEELDGEELVRRGLLAPGMRLGP
jgi:methionyl-tRNA formyltransferase